MLPRMTMKTVRMVFVFLFSACCQTACAQQQSAETPVLSNQQISEYVRKAFNVPGNLAITVKDIETSSIEGLREVKLEFISEKGTQSESAWVTKDNRLIVGRLMDMSVDPYKKNWDKVSFKDVPATGSADAKVTIVEYSDFQCPFCSQAHQTVEQLLKDYDGKVKVLFKHLPLGMHPWAEDAAVAGVCVYQQNNDAFWQLSHFLFTSQKTVKKETLQSSVLEATKDTTLNMDQLKKCMDSRQTLPVVKANQAEAASLGFSSTPSFLVNGRPVVGAIDLPSFKKIVDEALAGSQ